MKIPVVSSGDVIRVLKRAGFDMLQSVARVVTQHFIKSMARDANCLLSSQKGENFQKGRCYLFFNKPIYRKTILSDY